MKEWKATQPGGDGDVREIGFLPFPVEDVMCPGETKALHLYEVRASICASFIRCRNGSRDVSIYRGVLLINYVAYGGIDNISRP